ncbi:hypothetical protein MSAN_02049400 [Mycena sanguinolenta]|uniref:Uncharacterized protein n=1 Tax=Mycena sanguinolenta TaxID=230812 RepID=A0A8H7CLB3_9AGAR|nr:hypothetical protein MSAN_02049400 [Mycena sanguinolenta]
MPSKGKKRKAPAAHVHLPALGGKPKANQIVLKPARDDVGRIDGDSGRTTGRDGQLGQGDRGNLVEGNVEGKARGDPKPSQLEIVLEAMGSVAMIGGIGGEAGNVPGSDEQRMEGGRGEGNYLSSTFVYHMAARGHGVVGGIGGTGDGVPGGTGGGNTVHHDYMWYDFGDTTAVPTTKIGKFCADYSLEDALEPLEEYGITTANALFELEKEDLPKLEDLGLKGGHIAGLKNALKKLVAQSKTESRT